MQYLNSLLFAVFILINVSRTLQTPLLLNYTNELLRTAKAAEIRAFMNQDHDACDDFYEFSCGNWKRSYPAKAGNKKTSYLEQLHHIYVSKSRQILVSEGKSDNAIDNMLKDFYHSCENTEAIKLYGLEAIINVVDFKGGWPQVTSPSWYEYEYDWLKVIAEVRRKLGVNILVGMDVIPDLEDKFMHRIKIGAPELALKTRDAYGGDKYERLRESYKDEIRNKLRNYFPDMPPIWAQEVADQVLSVERELARGLADNPNLTIEQTSRQRYPSELKTAYGSYVDLNRYLNLVFNQTIYGKVYENPIDYLANLVEIIHDTPKVTLANYTMWRVLSSFDYTADVNRKQYEKTCVQKVLEYFPHQLEAMFYRNYNNRIHMLNELNSVWAEITNEFRRIINNSSAIQWMSEPTRQKTLQKLDAMELDFSTHDQIEAATAGLDGMILHSDRYYENLISILKWRTQQNLAKLIEKPIDDIKEAELPKYQLTRNKIQIPVTFFQARFFWDDAYPQALKFSTLGVLLAQEMFRGFDHIGRKYDKSGYQRTWWDQDTELRFDERIKCFERQYSHYTFRGKEIEQGPNFLSTVISDNSALTIAFRAYDHWLQNAPDDMIEKNEDLLPYLNYPNYSLFLIGYAQLFCSDYHESVTKIELTEHTRVNGVISNFKPFRQYFHCETDTEMVSMKKCSIYT